MRSFAAALLVVLAVLAVAWLPAIAEEAATTQPVVAEPTPAEAAPAEEPLTPEKEQDVLRLMEVTGASRFGDMVVEQVLRQIVASNPDLMDQVDELRAEVDTNDLTKLLIPVYAKHFTHEDIKGLLGFFDSPLGQKFMAAQSNMGRETMQTGQLWGMKVSMMMAQRIKERQEAATQPAEPEAATTQPAAPAE